MGPNPRVTPVAVVVAIAACTAARAPVRPDRDHELYRASIAAADGRLRLHDVADARGWLATAPAHHRGWEWRHLWADSDRSTATFEVDGGVTDLAVSPDGRTLAVAHGERGAATWTTAASPQSIATFDGHTKTVWAARFSPTSDRLATTASDGTVRVWRTADRTLLWTAPAIGKGIARAAWSTDGTRLATCSWILDPARGVRGVVSLFDADGKHLRTIEHGSKPIVDLAFRPGGTELAAGTWDHDVQFWDAHTLEPIRRLVPPASEAYKAIQAIAFDATGAQLAVAAKDGSVRVWDVESSTLVRTLVGQAEGAASHVEDVAFAGPRVVAAQGDGTVRVWGLDGRPLAVLHGHAAAVRAVAVIDDQTLFTGDAAGVVKRWSLAELARETWSPGDTAYGVAFAPAGDRVAATGWGGWIAIREVATGRELARWIGHDESGVAIAWSSDARWLATTGNDGRVRLWDAETHALRTTLLERTGQIADVAFSHDGKLIAAATPTAVVVWRLDGGVVVELGPGGPAYSKVAFDPHGEYLAAARTDGKLSVWRLPETRPICCDLALDGPVTFAFFHATPRGRPRLAIADRTGTIAIRELDRELGTSRSANRAGVSAIAISHDNTRMVTADADKTFRIRDATGRSLLAIPTAEAAWSVAIAPGDRRVVLVPLDATVRLLDAP